MRRYGPVSLVLALGGKKPRSLTIFLVISLSLAAIALLAMPAPKRIGSRLDGMSVEAVPIDQHEETRERSILGLGDTPQLATGP